MSAETDLYTTLKAASGVTNLVGGSSSPRIYPDLAPQEATLPCVGYQRVGTEITGTLSSAVVATKATLDVWCMAATRLAAEGLADAVQTACAAAWYTPTARRSEYDPDAALWAAVLTVDYWE